MCNFTHAYLAKTNTSGTQAGMAFLFKLSWKIYWYILCQLFSVEEENLENKVMGADVNKKSDESHADGKKILNRMNGEPSSSELIYIFERGGTTS